MNWQSAGLTSFVGRNSEIASICAALVDNRLVTISGPGGVGKTRLALHSAARQHGAFADGSRTVALESTAPESTALESPPSSPARAVAAELGIEDVSADAADQVAAFLADASLLLVLDGCEHVARACAELVEKVLTRAPGVRVLATSRHVLGVDGEAVVPIGPLPVPRVVDGELTGPADAVALFADRASAAAPGFAVTDANRDAVVRLCALLDGMPLAIELATAWLRVLSLTDLLERIEGGRGLPPRAGKSRPDRHQTLDAAMDWSFGLCSPQERVLWARLSVFEGDFGLAAAEAVCAGEPIGAGGVLVVLAGLVDKSIVRRERDDRSTCYRMLETTRRYGRDRLGETGRTGEFRARHFRYHLDLAESACDGWLSAAQPAIAARLRREHANLRAALEFGLGDPATGQAGARLAALLDRYWTGCGLLDEGRRWLDRALALDDLPPGLRAELLTAAARAAATLGDRESSLRLAGQGVRLARRTGDAELLSQALAGEGVAALHAGDLNRAEVAHRESALWGERAQRPDRHAHPPHLGPALVALARGDARGAEEHAQRIIDFSLGCGELWHRSYGHCVMAISTWARADLAATRSHAAECVRIATGFDDPGCLVLVAETLADVAVVTGDHWRAAGILGLADRLWAQMGGAPRRGNPVLPAAHRRCAEVLRRLLGAERFAAAYEVGVANSTSLERAAKFLAGGADRDPGPLTRRQMDVAEHLAHGRTNKEIAAELSISPRTVDVHVDHILRKLGFTSRVQVGVWFAAR
ncbi:MAG TPA: LuxR C-terminal-related transcriptional regulator [Pseudonocardia sp.]|nr:LuxR C-terminal-related transcriptional regulator [Pseudonocardia sp.]